MNKREILLGSIPGVFISIAAFLFAWIVHPNLWVFLSFFLLITLSSNIYFAYKKGWVVGAWGKQLLYNLLSTSAFIIVLYYLGAWLGDYGFLGLLLLVMIIVGVMIYRRWDLYKEAVEEGANILHGRRKE